MRIISIGLKKLIKRVRNLKGVCLLKNEYYFIGNKTYRYLYSRHTVGQISS